MQNKIQALIIFFLMMLPVSGLVAQFKLERDQLSPRHLMTKEKLWQKNVLTQQDSNLTLIGLWPWGPCISVAAKDHYAFIGNGGLFQVFDLSTPAVPQIIGELFFGGLLVYDLALSGNYAFILDGDLKVVDVSQPTNPTLAAKLTVPSDFAHRIVVAGNYAYLGTASGKLIIVDISTPDSPVVKSTTVLNDEFVMGMAVSGQHLFLTLESPLDPIYIYDVSNPSNPTLAGTYAVRNTGFATAGKYLYLYASGGNFQILDVTVATSPQLVGQLHTGFAGRIAVKDGLVYVIARNPLLGIIDVSDPTQPVLRGTAVGTATSAASLGVAPPLVVTANEIGFWIIDASDIDRPSALTHFATGDGAQKVTVVENLGYLVCSKAGLFIVDIADPGTPRFVSNLLFGGTADDIVVIDSLAYISGYSLGENFLPELRIVNISQPSHPQLLAQVLVLPQQPLGGYPTSVAVFGPYAFVTYDEGFSIVNVGDPRSPNLVKMILTDRIAIDIAATGRFACLAHADKGLKIFDVSDPTDPREKFTLIGFSAGVITKEDTIFVALSPGLSIFTISPSGDTSKLGDIPTPGSRSTVDIRLERCFVYMAYGIDLVVIDISNPSNLSVVGHAQPPFSANGVAVKAENVYLAGGVWALQIYRNDLLTHVGVKDIAPSSFSPQLYPCYPNPFNSLTTIEYEIPRAGNVQLQIYNLLGEEVAQLVNGWQGAGVYRAVFDAKNLPSGVYFYQLRVNGWQESKKLLILR